MNQQIIHRTTARSGRHLPRLLGAVAALSLVASACGGGDSATDGTDATNETGSAATSASNAPASSTGDTSADSTEAPATEGAQAAECESLDEISLQLQWVTQAQFAGYYAADTKGFYEALCLDVNIIEGGVDIVPQTQLANGDVDFAVSWVSKALASREAGANITNIAQIFQRSGTLQVSFADAGITSPEDFAGKRIGNWGFGNEYEVFAALGQAGLDPASDVELVGQNFDMLGLLDGSIDAAEAMTYNEYAQVLEAVNPDTGELYQPEDFNVINYSDVGVGMLQDAIWADQERLESDPEYRDQAVRFVAASLQGWAFCRDNPEECQQIVVDTGAALGASHQLWMMNEVNKLIWPSAEGAGYIVQDEWDQTVELSLNTPNLEGTTVLTEEPTEGAYTNDIVEEAWALLEGQDIDLTGDSFTPIEVTLNEGGT